MSKRLLIFSIIYTVSTIYFIHSSQTVAHGGEIIVLILPTIWIVGLMLLYLLYKYDNGIQKNRINKIILFFCTPIPTLIFIVSYFVWETKILTIKNETMYEKNGHLIKATHYPFKNSTEYRSNFDTPNEVFLIDSIVYFDSKTNQYKTDVYTDWRRYLHDENVYDITGK